MLNYRNNTKCLPITSFCHQKLMGNGLQADPTESKGAISGVVVMFKQGKHTEARKAADSAPVGSQFPISSSLPQEFERSFREINVPSPIHNLMPIEPSLLSGSDLTGGIYLISAALGKLSGTLKLAQSQGMIIDLVALGTDVLIAQYQKPPLVAWVRQSDHSWAPMALAEWTRVEGTLCKVGPDEVIAAHPVGGIVVVAREPSTGTLSARMQWEDKKFLGVCARGDGGIFTAESNGQVSFYESLGNSRVKREWTAGEKSPIFYISSATDGSCVIARAGGAIEFYPTSRGGAAAPLTIPASEAGNFLGLTASGYFVTTKPNEVKVIEPIRDELIVHHLPTAIRPVCVTSLAANELFLGGFRGECEIWRKNSQGAWTPRTLPQHSDFITACGYEASYGLISCSYDRTLRFWGNVDAESVDPRL